MTTEEFIKLLNDNKTANVEFEQPTTINHKPHQYCITDKHLKYNNSICLGEQQILAMEKEHGPMCGMYVNDRGDWANGYKSGYHKCTLRYEEHTSDRVIPIKCYEKISKFPCDLENIKEVRKQLKIDGFLPIDCFSNKEKE